MFREYQLKRFDYILAILVVGLSIFGVFAIKSATPYDTYYKKQILGLFCAIILMLVVAFIDYKFIAKFYIVLYILGLILLLSLKVIGKNVNGAVRWIPIGDFMTVQPSEFVKIIMVIVTAKFYNIFKDKKNHPLVIGGIILITAVPTLLVLKQPDLSSSLVFIFVLGVLILCSGISYKFIVTVIALVIPAIVLGFWYIQQPDQNLLEPHQIDRIESFLHPEEHKNAGYYQQYNSVMAIGSGQLNGKGLANSQVSSVKNGSHIIEPQTDFIFAIIGEELGFKGTVIVLFISFLIVVKGLLLAKDAQDLLGKLIAIGVVSIIACQTFINVGVATALLPNTGIPCPFISYGLSSLWSCFAGIGLLLNISMQRKKVLGKSY